MASVLRTIEVDGESERSWEEAAAQAVANLGRQLMGNIKSIHAENLRGNGGDREILGYRVEVRVSLRRSQPALAPVMAARGRAGHDRDRRLAR